MRKRRFRITADRLERWAPGLLVVAAAALYLGRLGSVGLYDLDEAVYAEISREMAALGDWVTPHLDYLPYLEKPPLLFWCNAAAFKAVGVSAFSARLATALAAIAGVGLAYRIGRDLWSRRAGLAAGAILATSFGYFVFGRMALPEIFFTVLLTAAFAGFSRGLAGEAPSRAAMLGGYAATGGAVLAKGVLGLLFPVLTVGSFLLIVRDRRLLRRLELFRGGALFLLIAVPWHLLMERAHPGFLRFYFIEEHLARFLGHRELQNYATLPIAAYLAISLVWFCPWSLFLPAAIRACWPRDLARGGADRGSLFILLWAAVVIGFFAVSAARLEYYALPALPALALCVGRLWDRLIGEPDEPRWSRGLTATWTGLVAFAVCLLPAACLFPRLEHRSFYNLFPDAARLAGVAAPAAPASARIYLVPGFAPLVPLFEVVVVLIVAGIALSAWAWHRRRPRLALAAMAGAMAVGLAALEDGFRRFEPYRSSVALTRVLRDELRGGDQIVLDGKYELHAGLGFYTGQRIRIYRGQAGVLWYDSRHEPAGGTFLSDEDFARLWRGPDRVYFLSDAPDGWARLRAVSAASIVLGRTGNSWLFANRAGHLTAAQTLPSYAGGHLP